jgi:hypothetical protein
MSYQEKRSVVNIILGALVMAAYCVYAFGKYHAGAVDLYDLKFFAVTMLTFIGIGVGAIIVVQIIFHILLSISVAVKQGTRDEKKIGKAVESEFVEDEMDKLIELKSERFGMIIIGIGFITGLVTLAVGQPPAIMLNILFLSCGAGSLAGGVLSLYYYRAGIR